MKTKVYIVFAAFLAGCSSPVMETPISLDRPFAVYPEASVYRLLSAPRDLEGARIRTYGCVEFYFDGSVAFLFASRRDANERLPLNFIELHFSESLKAEQWFTKVAKAKVLFEGRIVGVLRLPAADEHNQRITLEDVTEFDVQESKKKKPNQALQTTPMTRSVYEKTIEFGYPQRGV